MPTELHAPYLDQYAGLWAMHEEAFWAGLQQAKSLNLHVHLQSDRVERAQAQAASGSSFERQGAIALVGIHGSLMKQVSSMSRGTSTVQARRQVRAAVADPDIAGIMLHIDSPGGTVAGTEELAADIAAAAARKPVHAFVEDLGASAAYWLASQATRISSNATALVGSIGTYGVVYDLSGAAAMEGVKAHVMRAGAFKGAGVPGTAITNEQLAEWQRVVDELNEHFLAGVAKGRALQMDRVRELADGRVHLGAEAQKLGLIDSVESFDRAFSRLANEAPTRRTRMAMSDHITPTVEDVQPSTHAHTVSDTPPAQSKPAQQAEQPVAASVVATYEELKGECAGADAAFLVAQLEAKATVEQARRAWMAEQQRRIEAANKAAEDAKAAAARPGVDPVQTGGGKGKQSASGDDHAGEFWGLVDAKVKAGMQRPRAIASVVRENPDLHQEMIEAANSGRAPRR